MHMLPNPHVIPLTWVKYRMDGAFRIMEVFTDPKEGLSAATVFSEGEGVVATAPLS